MGLENRGCVCWKALQEEEHVLGGCDEREVRHLEKERGDLGSEDGPAVIFVFPKDTGDQ